MFILNNEFILTTKLDGSRLICIKEDNNINFFSRQGQVVEGLADITNDMKKLQNGVYDGELIAIGDFKDSKEQFAETMKRSRVKGLKSGLKFVCYDYIENINDKEENLKNFIETDDKAIDKIIETLELEGAYSDGGTKLYKGEKLWTRRNC